ncbi:MAG TPA: hydrolase [Myxococcales bacterium]|nr:hydrolase [Myxococcales bacterium]
MSAKMGADFCPAWWLPGRHPQTIVGRYLRIKNGVTFRRERWDTPDGDFLDLDFAEVGAVWTDRPESTPIVIVLHGLEGSARSGYAYELYKRLASHGIRPLGLNFRSCSGELNRGARLYHSGETSDFEFVLNRISERYPAAPLGAVGVSLGANVLLCHLGKRGENTLLSAGASISAPFDLAHCSDALDRNGGRIYGRWLLRKLHTKVRQKRSHLESICNVDLALSARSLREFDNHITAPVFGFDGANDYYRQCSTAPLLSTIARPTQILRSSDDPFHHGEEIPEQVLQDNPHLRPLLVNAGGHVGFVTGNSPFTREFWAEKVSAEFLAQALA